MSTVAALFISSIRKGGTGLYFRECASTWAITDGYAQ